MTQTCMHPRMPRLWSASLKVVLVSAIGFSRVEGAPVDSFVEVGHLHEVSLDDERTAVEGLDDGYQEDLDQRRSVHGDEDETDLMGEAEDTLLSDDEMMKMMIDHGDLDDDYSEDSEDDEHEEGASQLENIAEKDSDDEPQRVGSCEACLGGCFAKNRCHRKRPDNGMPMWKASCESHGGRWCRQDGFVRESAILALMEQEERDEETIANLPDYQEEEATHEERLS